MWGKKKKKTQIVTCWNQWAKRYQYFGHVNILMFMNA
jgi:hypothetical protein